MPWNGSGLFTRIYSWAADALAGIYISSSRMDGEFDNYATGLNNCLTKDGQNSPTNNLPMATKRHTNVGEATARDEYLRVAEYQDAKPIYGGTAGGDADDLTLTLTPTISAYVEGMMVIFKGNVACNDDATMNIDTVGARQITADGANIIAGDIQPDVPYMLIYTGSSFELISAFLFRKIVAVGAAIEAETPTDDTTFTHNAITPIPMSVEIWDAAGYHSGANPSRLTIPTDLGGLYLYSGRFEYDPVSTMYGTVSAFIRKGGSGENQDTRFTGLIYNTDGRPGVMEGTGIIVLDDAEYIEICFKNQHATIDCTLHFTNDKAAQLSLVRLGDAP